MIRLIIFARYPAPGKTKTRLIPALGPAEAARLQHAMTLRTLNAARALRGQEDSVHIELRYTGASQTQLAGLYGRDIAHADQGEGDLGARMSRALQDALDAGCWPVLVGSDCPAMDAGILHAACQVLDRRDLVLGPAADGGYYLIGMRRPASGLLADIPWSTSTVLQRTLAAAERLRLRYELLPELADVDKADDLAEVRWLIPQTHLYRPGRIAITGATGSLGLAFLRALVQRYPRVHVTALVRPGSARPEEFRRLVAKYGEQVEPVEGDLCRPGEAVRRAFREAQDGIWHFAACTQLQCRDERMRRELWRTNVEGTRVLVSLCPAEAPLYHISTAYVCGRRTGMICEADLDASCGFRNVYEESKFAAEQIVRAALEGGRPGAVFRPSVVVEAQSSRRGLKVVDQLADALAVAIRRHGPGMTLRAAEGWGINAVAGQWVVERMLELASAGCGRTYHLTAPEMLALGQLRDAVQQLYPWFQMELSPGAAEVRGLSRSVDRALARYRDYLAAAGEVVFDRIHMQLYASGADEPALDLAGCLQARVGITPRAGAAVPS